MKFGRREFLAGGAAAALAGCGGENLLRAPWGTPPPPGPYVAPTSDAIDPISHVLSRITFGARPEDYGAVMRYEQEAPLWKAQSFIYDQLHPDSIDDRYCDWRVRRLESLGKSERELYEYKETFLLGELTRGAILRAVFSRRQLKEVMVEFWRDHFNIDPSKGDAKYQKTVDDRDVIRKHAMGRFSSLVSASALSPAMLWYLDGRSNKRSKPEERPNENYARELMELHTLGVHGGYTQKDVMEAARCLTGWTVHPKEFLKTGKLEFIPENHDDGPKEVLGHKLGSMQGEGDLHRLIQIVCEHPSTARHIAGKLCRRFISDDPPEDAVRAVAEAFAGWNGDITQTLRVLFMHEAFWSSAGTKFKRPFHFVASALRATGATTDAGQPVIEYLQRMGHAPFRYPTPDGYPEEASPWMGGLLWRWNFAAALAAGRLEKTRVEGPGLVKDFSGDDNLMAHLFGRRATAEETAAYHASGQGLALALASPAFQRY